MIPPYLSNQSAGVRGAVLKFNVLLMKKLIPGVFLRIDILTQVK